MNALLMLPEDSRRQILVDFDPSKESQDEVEARSGVTYSEYFESRADAEFTLRSRQADSF